MATKSNTKKESRINSFRLKLIAGMTIAPEARNEEKKPPYPAGRFKRFFDTYKANSPHFMTANALALIFALPILAVVVVVAAIGVENLAYMLAGITDAPYLMGSFGIGLSSSMPLNEARLYLLDVYRLIFLAIGVGIAVLSFGAAGHVYISTKLIWGESFLTKKDKKTGADVPRIATEFFRGVKTYWKEMLIVFSAYGVFFAGGTNLIVEFVYGVLSGGANVGQWFALFIGALILLITTPIFFNLVPQVVSYHKTLTIAAKIKNACIYSLAFAIPTYIMVVLAFGPFALLAINSPIVTILIGMLLIVFGLTYVFLIMVNYGDHNSENVLQTLYENMRTDQSRQTRKEKKKTDVRKQSAPVKYKKKKK